jgi:hypothetical protein
MESTLSLEIVGHAIVSADGRIADRDHRMPAALRSEADWQRFQAALDAAALVVLGRLGHEAHANPGRRRLVATRRVASLAPDPADPRATLWNPAGIDFDAALGALDIPEGIVAVTGGTGVFDLFLPRFTRFDLARVPAVTLPEGLPCFSAGPPDMVLAAAGLRPDPAVVLDPRTGLAVWRRYDPVSQ